MKKWALFILLLGIPGGQERLWAQATAAAPVVTTSTSQTYPQVTCTCSDDIASATALQMAADTRDQLAPLLQLGRNWRFPVHIHIVTPDDPAAAKVHGESVQVIAGDKTMSIEAVLLSTDPEGQEFVQRQYVTALLWERFFYRTLTFDTNTHLDIVPLWLIEGLRESLHDDTEHNRESIVRRAVENHRAPTLVEVTSWQQLSNDRLLGFWQRSFCYYLFNTLTRSSLRRSVFQQWLASFASADPTAPPTLFPTEADWQRELLAATARSRDIVYTWDETQVELATAETITIPATKTTESRIFTIDTVTTQPRDKILLAALQQKFLDLTRLELRAHPSWHPILELYRAGLTALINDQDSEQAGKLLRLAHEQRVAEVNYHQQLLDYVNWFEVTKDYAGNTSHFRAYFSTAQEMERVEADPDHPNPIRANLLQVESQL